MSETEIMKLFFNLNARQYYIRIFKSSNNKLQKNKGIQYIYIL